MLVESRPYIKKFNLTQDKAQWTAWQVHLRIEVPDTTLVGNQDDEQSSSDEEKDDDGDDGEEKKVTMHERDLFVTAVRRRFIPPLMECY